MDYQVFVIINDFSHNGASDMNVYHYATKEDALDKFFELVKEEISGNSIFYREFTSNNVEVAPLGVIDTKGSNDEKDFIIHQYNEKYSREKPCLQFWGVSNKKSPGLEHDFIRLHKFSI